MSKKPDRPKCPNCHCEHLPVKSTRHFKKKTRRIRQCRNCGRRITTWEEIKAASK